MAQPAPDDQFARLLAALIALYVSAEQRLLGGVAGILRLTSPTVAAQLEALSRMRRLTRQVVGDLDAGTALALPRLLRSAESAGASTARRELEKLPGSAVARVFDFGVPHGVRAVEAIRRDLVSDLTDVRARITRLPDDVYKLISPAAAAGQVFGHGYTPAQAQAYAWRDYVDRGVTGFVDRSGRNWSLSAYVEMSVRTASTRAYNAAHLEVMQAARIDLFTVSNDGHPCPLCFPWQGRVLSDGPDPRADATIAEARAAGLWHPNCRHTLLPFIPGKTPRVEPRDWSAEDQRLYDLTQKQRRLELEIRKAKKREEYAASPEAKSDARGDVRAAQARMRSFIADTGFLRQSRREQVDLANDHLKLPA